MNSEKIFIFMGKSAVFVLSLPNKIARLSAVCIITKYITLILNRWYEKTNAFFGSLTFDKFRCYCPEENKGF